MNEVIPSAGGIYGRWDYLMRTDIFHKPIRIGVMTLMLMRGCSGDVDPMVRLLGLDFRLSFLHNTKNQKVILSKKGRKK